MGMNGGAKMVRAFMCTTCGRLHNEKPEAVRCCNDKMYMESAARAQAKVTRALANTVVKSAIVYGGMQATCTCSRCPHTTTVTVNLKGWRYGATQMTRVEAEKKAAALSRAQMARHLSNCFKWR